MEMPFVFIPLDATPSFECDIFFTVALSILCWGFKNSAASSWINDLKPWSSDIRFTPEKPPWSVLKNYEIDFVATFEGPTVCTQEAAMSENCSGVWAHSQSNYESRFNYS
jgi:hypothetical protein